MRYSTQLFIDLNLLGENVHLLRSLCPRNDILFMVKADGYGHGMISVVRYAVTELGIKEFGLATIGEARRLREELSNLKFEIYVFSDIQFALRSCYDLYLNYRIIPVISCLEDLEFVLKHRSLDNVPLVLKFNTGMNRLGLESSDLEKIGKMIKDEDRKSIFHLLSHFSSSSSSIDRLSISEGGPSITQEQYDLFLKIKKYFQDSKIEVRRTSIANSGAIEQGFALQETHIRPGLMLYGPTSLDKEFRHLSKWTGQNISLLETYIIKTFPVSQGTPIGYGATRIPSDGTVALIALGYGDGFSTRFQGARLKFEDHYGEIFGKVNMDMAQIFFPGEPPSSLKAGEKFQIWGHSPQDILDLADQTQTIPYELFCQLTNRIPRIYGLRNIKNKVEFAL